MEVRTFAERLLVISDALGVTPGAMAAFTDHGTSGFRRSAEWFAAVCSKGKVAGCGTSCTWHWCSGGMRRASSCDWSESGNTAAAGGAPPHSCLASAIGRGCRSASAVASGAVTAPSASQPTSLLIGHLGLSDSFSQRVADAFEIGEGSEQGITRDRLVATPRNAVLQVIALVVVKQPRALNEFALKFGNRGVRRRMCHGGVPQ